MLDHVLSRPGEIRLRLYTWSEGTITLGLNQEVDRAIDRTRLGTTPLIRRVTGGRAVYHDVSELTYAVAINPEAAGLGDWGRSVSSVYVHLAQALQTFLESIGLTARLVRRSSDQSGSREGDSRRACFASAARYELMADGEKIVASAQRQVGGTLLQHGSIKLAGVVAHPALFGVRSSQDGPQPLEKTRFDWLAERFGCTWEAVLGRRLNKGEVTPVSDKSLGRHLEMIRSSPLDRYDSFEHY